MNEILLNDFDTRSNAIQWKFKNYSEYADSRKYEADTVSIPEFIDNNNSNDELEDTR
ncbi:12327_t:CDS:2 [Funneliformis caledonium]|uniref:12327_t:CDS:1 n=1 Tax=Funneliformis caledonium TaxID=1117310 RepID=A0A9N9CE44_9GLOM|nr:12327_t:CDS:2 [Funneliformis caledonium]